MPAVEILDEAAITHIAEYACARCWKHKKKCDRKKPICGRCTMQASVCTFVALPPKKCVLTVDGGKDTSSSKALNGSGSGTESAEGYSTSQASVAIPTIVCHPCDEQKPLPSHSVTIVDQLSDILGAISDKLESACKSYFRTFHCWLPFLCETDFWRDFSSLSKNPDPNFTIQAIGIYLLTYSPSQNANNVEFADSVYSTVKSAWIHLQRSGDTSLALIEAGLLLATFEHGQTLEEQERLSMSICITASKARGLDKSLRQSVTNSSVSEIQLARSRRLWWAIVIHERLFAQRDLDQSCSYESNDPALDDYLPFDIDESSARDLFVGTIEHSNCGPKSSNITFPEVDAFARLPQAIYLVSLVEGFNREHLSTVDETGDQESIKLDEALRNLALSLLRQSSKERISKGRYCTAFFLCVVSLAGLHRHMLTLHTKRTKACGNEHSLNFSNNCSRSFLSLQTLARMYYDVAMSKTLGSADFLQVPPYQMYALYVGAVLHIQAGDRTDKAEWERIFEHTITYISLFTPKWKIAEVYLEKLKSMRGTLSAYPLGGLAW